jgi:hypothetical protein
MIWLNLKTTTLRSPEYAGSEPIQRATWLNLLAYCCEQENGGRIDGCAEWKDRQWQQTLGVTLAEVREDCALWHWDGEALCVAFYPTDKQEEVKAKRDAGKRGGKHSGKSRREAVREAQLEGVLEAQLEAELQPNRVLLEAQLERKGKEGEWKDKGKETLTIVSDGPSGFDLPQVIEAGRRASIPEDVCRAYHDDREGAGWLDGKGRRVSSMPHDLSGFWRKWQSNRSPKQFGNGQVNGSGNPKPEGVWQLQQRIEAAQKEIDRISGNPSNKEQVPDSFDRRLKAEPMAKVKQLKASISEMRQRLAGVEVAA